MCPVRRQTSRYASRLRRDRTEAEERLWQVLRNRQVDGWKFRFQASLAPYVVDFLCIEARLIVEVDGGQHNAEVDASRMAGLEARGYRVIRFWNNDVLGNLEGVVETIRATLARKKTLTQPSPAKAGEGYGVR